MTKTTPANQLSAVELRKFSISVGVAFVVVFGLLLSWVFDKSWPVWPWLLAAVLITWGLVHPQSLQPVYRGWMLLGVLLHKIVSPIVLGLMFYLLFTPISLLIRLFGKKLIDTRFDTSVASYRTTDDVTTRDNYERPF